MTRLASGRAQTPTGLAEQLNELSNKPTTALRNRWARLYRTQPPKRMSRDLLVLAISWKIQSKAMGGLNMATKRRLMDTASRQGNEATGKTIRLKAGTRLVREWHGEPHEVLVLEERFEWQGKPYRSLSQIAREITGVRWSGPRFFGLKPKPDNFAHPGCHDHAA